MGTPYLGTIMMWAADYAPRGWAFCHGQRLNVRQHEALFLMLRETYGGDGVTTFALPDLVGRAPVGAGSLGGGDDIVLGSESPVVRGGVPDGGCLLRGALAVNYVICLDGRFPEPA